jgi:hypothetical protein
MKTELRELANKRRVVHLQERFGDRYRVVYEESYYAQHGARARVVDPWFMIIPCQHGHIYPHGDGVLGFASDKKGPVAKRVSQLDFVTTLLDGEDGVNVAFPEEWFEAVAYIVKPRRRRRLSEEHRQKLLESSRRYQFSHGSGAPDSAQESPLLSQRDSESMLSVSGPKCPA